MITQANETEKINRIMASIMHRFPAPWFDSWNVYETLGGSWAVEFRLAGMKAGIGNSTVCVPFIRANLDQLLLAVAEIVDVSPPKPAEQHPQEIPIHALKYGHKYKCLCNYDNVETICAFILRDNGTPGWIVSGDPVEYGTGVFTAIQEL